MMCLATARELARFVGNSKERLTPDHIITNMSDSEAFPLEDVGLQVHSSGPTGTRGMRSP
jgi:hypothetical protein